MHRTKSCPERIETYTRSPWYAAILSEYRANYPGITNRIEFSDDDVIMSILEFNAADEPQMREIECKLDEIIAATSRCGARREDVIMLVWGEFEYRARIRMQEILELVHRHNSEPREALITIFEKNIQDLRPRLGKLKDSRKRKRGCQEFAIPATPAGRCISSRQHGGD